MRVSSINIPNGLSEMNINSIIQLGELVRKQRKALGLTQVEAAGLCGVGERFLRELEHGKPTIETGRMLQVMAGLGIELDAKVREP
ncbi:MAG: transcriptional regulator [Wenzhouxiangella sp.]|nr:MAG: transcriptional regulator [Wenzhouxiangella sp.]